jgi:peptidoglycan hydrolase-like protein with peptidoglycan-binding domain
MNRKVPKMLNGSVGLNGMNARDDTKTVQLLLNDYLGRKGLTLLKIDGIAGPLTLGAISQYQLSAGLPRDGRIDPKGPTLKHLVGSHFETVRSAMASTHHGAKLMRYAKNDPDTTGQAMSSDWDSWYLGIIKTHLK